MAQAKLLDQEGAGTSRPVRAEGCFEMSPQLEAVHEGGRSVWQ